jgi:propanol-preferring alcohol dehydrogenase
MKAAVLHEFKQPLRIEDVPTPECGADEVLIQVEASGVCHSGLHLADGDWPELLNMVKMKSPVILGHEVVGRVAVKGDRVGDLEVGERVGVPWVHWTCGQCEFCREGNENLCPGQAITGCTVDGGHAEFCRAKASHVTKIPGTLRPEEAAPLFCAGVTVYRAARLSGIRAGQRVAVYGVGGLGHLAIQLAKNMGGEVMAVDISEDKLALARSLGAERTLNAATEDVVSQLRAAGGVHVALVTSAAKAAYDAAFYSLRPGGTLAVVGIPAENLTFSPIALVGAEARIISSAVGTRKDQREVVELAAAGKLRCHVETRPLDQINQVFDQLRQGRVTGRVVLTM